MSKCCGSSTSKNQTSNTSATNTASPQGRKNDNTCSSQQNTTCSSPSVTTSGGCCGSVSTQPSQSSPQPSSLSNSCCGNDSAKPKFDWMLWGSTTIVLILYSLHLFSDGHDHSSWLNVMENTAFEMLNAMWWGILLGVLLVGWLDRIPRELVMATLGPGHTKQGLFRATLAGLMLDLCNHGILMVAMKLYERGASLGQVMAFLIASPWNSFTLTLILFGLIGIPWTLAFIAFSMIVALISGYVFDRLEMTGRLPKNPYQTDLPDNFRLRTAIKELSQNADLSLSATTHMLLQGIKGSRMVIRWIMFGVVLIALVRAFVPVEIFTSWFGASLAGLFLTLLAATVIEVCSEGSTPIAADLVNRASAPGNGFTFLMAGAATDYTEIMAIKDTMKSWKIALFLPLISVPQVLLIGWLMNLYGT